MAFSFLADHDVPCVEVPHARPKGARAEDLARAVNLPLAYVAQTVLVQAGQREVGIVHAGDARLDMEGLRKALAADEVRIVPAERAAEVAGVPARAIGPLALWKRCDVLWDERTLRLPVLCLATSDERLSVRVDTRHLRRLALPRGRVATRTAPAAGAYDVLLERGFVERVSDEDLARRHLADAAVAAYVGFDPSASSLHVGSLVPIMALTHVQRAGARAIAVVGGATGLIGDPSGKTEMRRMLTRESIAGNMAGISRQLSAYLRIDGERGRLVDNADWFAPVGALEFLRELGPHFSINQMVKSESVRTRMEREGEGLTFLELTYMLLQAYDFVRLAGDARCLVQMGGSDQWGNICAGIELGRRAAGGTLFGRPVERGAELVGVTFPLLTKASGGKFGKSESGNIWLDEERTSVYDFFQFWRNTDDADLERFLSLFTHVGLDEAGRLAAGDSARALNLAKEVLAFAVTALRHGPVRAAAAAANARGLFGGYDDDFRAQVVALALASEEDLAPLGAAAAAADAGARSAGVAAADLAAGGVTVVDALVLVGLAPSRSEARRLIRQGGAYVEGTRIDAADAKLPAAPAGAKLTLRVGKKKHGILEVK